MTALPEGFEVANEGGLPEGFKVVDKKEESMGFAESLYEAVPEIGGSMAMIGAGAPAIAASGPLAPLTTVALGTMGAMGGKGWQEAYNSLFRPEMAKTPEGVTSEVWEAGYWGALGEGAGQIIGKGLSLAAEAVRPKVSATAEVLKSNFGKYGGDLFADQLSDSKLVKFLSGIGEHSVVGQFIFKPAREAQQNIFKEMSADLTNVISKRSKDLSDEELGQLFLNTVKGGKAAHSSAATRLYNELDVLVAEREVVRTVTEEMPSSILDKSGKALMKPIQKAVKETVDNAPVDMKPIKSKAQELLDKLERTGNIAGEQKETILKTLASRPDSMLFGEANLIRSDLLTVIREMEDKLGKEQAKRVSNQFSDLITDAMSDAATKSGDPRLAKAYNRANSWWKRGKATFNNDFISGLVVKDKKTAERIGEYIFTNGNVTEIMQAKKALRTSAKLDKSLNYDEVWQSMQAGYLNTRLSNAANVDGMPRISSLKKLLLPKGKDARTFKTTFDKSQQEAIKDFVSLAEKIEAKPSSSLGMMVQLTQASAAGGLFALDLDVEGGAVLLGPTALAYIFTNPRMTRALISGMKTPAGTRVGREMAGRLLTRMTAEGIRFTREGEEEGP